LKPATKQHRARWSETSAMYYRVRMQACYALCNDQRPLDLLEGPSWPSFVPVPCSAAKGRHRSVTRSHANDSQISNAISYVERSASVMSLLHTCQGRASARLSHCYYENFLAKLPKPIAAPAGGGVVNHIKCAKDAAALAWLLDSTVCNPAEEASVRHQAVAMLTIQPPFLRRKRGQLDTPELVERLWRLLNTELSADCRLRCSVAQPLTTCCTAGTGPKLPWCSTCAKGRTKIAQRAPTPTPAPADTDEPNTPTLASLAPGVGLGSSGDEADVDDDLDIGLEDDYEFAPDEPPIDEADFLPGCRCRCTRRSRPSPPPPLRLRRRLTKRMLDDGDRDAAEDRRIDEMIRPTMSSEQRSSHWYQFWHPIDCKLHSPLGAAREPSFLAFLCAAGRRPVPAVPAQPAAQTLCSYLALGRDGSDSTFGDAAALPGRDRRHLRGWPTPIDNFCHTLETLRPRLGTPPVPAADFRARPLSGASGWPSSPATTGWLFMAAVRFAKIRWPLRANLWFSRRRTRNWMGAIWIVAMATSLCARPRGDQRAGRLSGRVQPDGRRRFAHLPGVHHGTVTPVVAVMVVNVLLLRTVRRSTTSSATLLAAAAVRIRPSPSALSAWPAAVERPAGCQQRAVSGKKPAAQKQEKQFRQLTRMVTLLMYM
uniref:ATP-dependent DNA helicase n=1 Tax=Macrostomum lignano TaxID=282301 RepID=A0A1I8FBJ3_9PLAT